MKKLIFSFFLCGATMFPAFSQTFQERYLSTELFAFDTYPLE